jgi:thiosulfate/3-mercaptopyruvate sulfurtransferase
MTRTRKLLGAAALLLLTACPIPRELRETRPLAVHSELTESVNGLQRRLNDPTTVILQVGRNRSEYDAGHIPGAHWLPLSSIVTERDGLPNELPAVDALRRVFEAAGVSDNSRVVVYGDPLPAGRAFFTLDYLGHPPAVLNGGLAAWRAAGKPVETTEPAARTGTFTPHPRPDVVVDADWVRQHLRDSTVVLIDARPPEEFSGATPGEGVQRPGHIAGAKNVFWRNTLVTEANPVLRGPDVLRAFYRLAGARLAGEPAPFVTERPRYEPPDTTREGRGNRRGERRQEPRRVEEKLPVTTVVTYCRTGVQASWDYYVARYLGYETKMYDASYLDWSRRGADYPVER